MLKQGDRVEALTEARGVNGQPLPKGSQGRVAWVHGNGDPVVNWDGRGILCVHDDQVKLIDAPCPSDWARDLAERISVSATADFGGAHIDDIANMIETEFQTWREIDERTDSSRARRDNQRAA